MFKTRDNTPKVKVLLDLMPRIYVTIEALTRMKYIVSLSKDEVGWFGTAYKFSDTAYLVNGIYLFEQEVHSTTCEITPEGLANFAQPYLEQNNLEVINNLKLWGHSHVNMSVGASGQDDKQMEVFKNSDHDWFLRVIANKRGEMEFALYDFTNGIIYEDVPWEMYVQDEARIAQEIQAELKAKVREKSNVVNYYKGYNSYIGGTPSSWVWDNDLQRYVRKEAEVEVTTKKSESKNEKEETKAKDDTKTSGTSGSRYPIIQEVDDVYNWFMGADLADIGEFIDVEYIDKDEPEGLVKLSNYISQNFYPNIPFTEKELGIIYDTAWHEYLVYFDEEVDKLTEEYINKVFSGNYNNLN